MTAGTDLSLINGTVIDSGPYTLPFGGDMPLAVVGVHVPAMSTVFVAVFA
ncbi:hypothetical protein [Rhodococcus sp. T2V]|nr:hypothetical protein [Rhodococcus sp. T2V]